MPFLLAAPAWADEPCGEASGAARAACLEVVRAVAADDVEAIVRLAAPAGVTRIDRYSRGDQSLRLGTAADLRRVIGPSLRGFLRLGPVAADSIRVVHHVTPPGGDVPSFLRVEVTNGPAFASIGFRAGWRLSLVIVRPRTGR